MSDGEEEFPGRLLHQAALWNNAELLEDLLHGEELHNLNSRDSLGRTALHAAVTNDDPICTRILLQAGANPNIASGPRDCHKTPLHVAVEGCHIEVIRLLLEYQADLLATDMDGLVPLDLAERTGLNIIVTLLQEEAGERELERQNLYLKLWNGCQNQDLEEVRRVLNQLDKDRQLVLNTSSPSAPNLLTVCCEAGNVEILKLLLENGADPFIHSRLQASPFFIVCWQGHFELAEVLLKTNPELVVVPNPDQRLPLHAATLQGHANILDLLLKFPYPSSSMKLHTDATGSWEYYFPFDINIKDNNDQTALYQAVLKDPFLVEILLRFKVRAQKLLNDSEHGILERPRAETNLCPVNLNVYCNSETALHLAIRNNMVPTVTILLKQGANPNLPILGQEGSSGLMEACRYSDIEMVDLLISHGAQDTQGSALSLAASRNLEDTVSKLLTLRAHSDPEFRINKKELDLRYSLQPVPSGTTMTYSSMFPTSPVMIDWRGQGLEHLQEQWFIEASLFHNTKLKASVINSTIVLTSITRIDISNNKLITLPLCLFQMPSLKILNASQNQLEDLPLDDTTQSPKKGTLLMSGWHCPVLEEVNLQENSMSSIMTCVFEIPSLINLDLSRNQLRSLPYKMWFAPKLRELNLSYNYLRELPTGGASRETFIAKTPEENKENIKHLPGEGQTLVHHNLWSQSVEVVDSVTPANQEDSQLTSLNLAHNHFAETPRMLACLSPSLTHVNLSFNLISEVGSLSNYPASLRHLDLSHNKINIWLSPSLPGPCFLNYSGSALLSPGQACGHVGHSRLENLRTLIIADNLLMSIVMTSDKDPTKLLFPNLSMLDLSENFISKAPSILSQLSSLSVLNLSSNSQICHLPPELGLLGKLWNLNLRGCSLADPLRTMVENKYKTMDIIGYLKSILEDAKPYARMKLMLVGLQSMGKTSLLNQLRMEGSGSYKKKPPEHWAKRMGNKNTHLKTPKGTILSTVGVDVGDWVYEKKIHGQSPYGSVTFRTWDFGGQKEYYATHQYFLSKRSIYLVVWKITDGEDGVNNILQWLVNIQARAPNSPVIIVGTHYDVIKDKYPSAFSEDLQQTIRARFINVVDADKCGLPRVLATIEVSCKTRHNIKLLCNMIYDTAFELRCPGSKERLLEQKIPATYLALEDVISYLAVDRHLQGKDPVLRADHYRMVVMHEMQQKFGKTFRDMAELNQATTFLHDNGVLLHYEDSTLKDIYFLDPQWLCDMLAHIVTIKEINPFAKNGIMKLDDVAHVLKLGQPHQSYLLSLLNKFEVALTWDSRTLLIPSLLPIEDQLRLGVPGSDVRIPVRSRVWAFRKSAKLTNEKLDDPSTIVSQENNPERCIRRLILMSYFPSGFWSRLITRLLADDLVIEAIRSYFVLPKELQRTEIAHLFSQQAEWVCWQTGLELRYLNCVLLQIKELLPHLSNSPFDYRQMKFLLHQEESWNELEIDNSAILEILVTNQRLLVKKSIIEPSSECVTKLLSLAVDHLDTLLEDWYPTLGTRFVHTSAGKFLVTRLVMCPHCLGSSGTDEESWQVVGVPVKQWSQPTVTSYVSLSSPTTRGSRGSASSHDSGVDPDSQSSSRQPSMEGYAQAIASQEPLSPCIDLEKQPLVYSFMVEECMLSAYEQRTLTCPLHGDLELVVMAPDTVFGDLGERYLIHSDMIRRGKMLGRGAFGFVFKAMVKQRVTNSTLPVAMKMLQPVDPGFGAKYSDTVAFKAAWSKWQRDPLQYACRAYCTARQELSILMSLRHPNIVPFVGISTHPLALVLHLAPQGSLEMILKDYSRLGAQLPLQILQKILSQISKALEYLHQQHIIYRDLKSENVLVWQVPPPFQNGNTQQQIVDVKLADYGISRSTLPTGTKGFGGTEGFMAPEIIRYNGEEEYTEKVDCFSFGMFIYELLTLHPPFEGQDAIKDQVLEGKRPALTKKELTYPMYVLDLMAVSWSQQSRDRPTSSQLVSFVTAPEFLSILDVVSLPNSSSVILDAIVRTNAADGGWELWLSRMGKQLDLIYGDNHNWDSYQSLSVDTTFTCMCHIDADTVWLGDSKSHIHIFKSYREDSCICLDSYTMLVIRSMIHIPELNCVALTANNGKLWVCSTSCDQPPQELGTNGKPLLCLAAIPIQNKCELWCGQNQGLISVFRLKGQVVVSNEILNHEDDTVDVTHMVAGSSSIWTYTYPGCIVYQWNVYSRTIVHKLDCSKLVPCSESLLSISIEEHLSLGRCQVTALATWQDHLYIGTTWGCVIVADTVNLCPITVFRPYEEDVKAILPLPTPEPLLVTVGKGYRNLLGRYLVLPCIPELSSQSPTLILWRTNMWTIL